MFQITILFFDLFALSIWYENTIVMTLIFFYLRPHIWFICRKRFFFSFTIFHCVLFLRTMPDKNGNVSFQFLGYLVYILSDLVPYCQKNNLDQNKQFSSGHPYWFSDILINYLIKVFIISSSQFLNSIFIHNQQT